MIGVEFAVVAALAAAGRAEDEIVILGRRLEQVEVSYTLDRKGRLRACSVSRSVGDTALDRFFCETAPACAGKRPTDATLLKACVD